MSTGTDETTCKRVLVTGGAGFIGSHLTERLLQRGVRVTVIDNLSTGCWSNLEHLNGDAGLRVLVCSAGDRKLLDREVQRHDFVYHLASAVGVKLVIERPVHTVETIYETTASVLASCSKYRRPVVITSTSEVYGKLDKIPFCEDADVVMGATSKRRWAYACAKALDEFLALAYYHETGLPVHIVRLFNTVGPRQTGRYGMVIPSLVEQALSGSPMTVYGDGTQRRCFCSVHDVVEALLQFPSRPNTAGKVINIGAQQEVSILQLAKRIKTITGSNSEIVLVPYDQAYGAGFDDMARRMPDLTRALQFLAWTPTRSLDDILVEIAEHLSNAATRSENTNNQRQRRALAAT